MEPSLRTYKISSKYKKATYSIEHWDNVIHDKPVVLILTTIWRWGEFNIDIYDKEVDELLESDHIVINDYSWEFISTTDGCERIVEIKNTESYSEGEKQAIYESIYENVEDEILHNEDVLEEENGWVLNGTIYEIRSGCELELDE
jgi:hypothetical protein|tara:strand:+ start:43 stop:477 length:435 start_codon:yes stop_codon:yes gene_type:complete